MADSAVYSERLKEFPPRPGTLTRRSGSEGQGDEERIIALLELRMMNDIIVSHEQAQQIFKAINGIGELLKRLPSRPEDAPVKYAIMSNLSLIQMNLTGMPRVSSH